VLRRAVGREVIIRGAAFALAALAVVVPAGAAERESASTSFDEGFVFVSRDDTMRLSAWAQLDGRWFVSGRASPDTFLVRRARLSAGGTLERDFNYFLMLAAERPQNPLHFAWVEHARFEFVRVRVGQFKQPFGLEELLADLYYEGPERSVWSKSFAPAHDIGAMAHGEAFAGVLEYALGVFNGRGRNVLDNGSHKDVAWRLTTRPIKNIALSTNATLGAQTDTLADYTTAGGAVFAKYRDGTTFSGPRTRVGADIEARVGSFLARAEVGRARLARVRSAGAELDNVEFTGWYVEALWLITGERKLSNRAVVPRRGFGAFELFARYDRFRADTRLFTRDIASGAATTESVAAGLNWWPNRHVRAGVHYVLTDAPAMLREHLVLFRAQFAL